MKQRTLSRKVSIQGRSLHTGEEVTLWLKPAPPDYGFTFRRLDLANKPIIKPDISQVDDLVRSTTITSGYAKVHTIEHVLSALAGCGIDNAMIELDASEPPILDGSAQPFVQLIQEAGSVDQNADRGVFEVKQPIYIMDGDRSLIALPYDGFKITCTSTDDRGIHTHHFSLDIDPETYAEQIAPARTFTVYEDIEELIKLGKIRGGSLDSAIVIKGDTILSKESLRFKEEFARHKILDIIGDLVLLGKPIKAHIIAIRPGHSLNSQLTKVLRQQQTSSSMKNSSLMTNGSSPATRTAPPASTETTLDINRLMQLMPHRYPFLMIDRVISIQDNKSLTALKNVSINEPYFVGHFPTRPVMPGVLQLEAMAQAAGALMLEIISANSTNNKIAFLMSSDKVKFRAPVVPGDQLIVEITLEKQRSNRLAVASATCKVNEKVVSSAQLMFSIIDEE